MHLVLAVAAAVTVLMKVCGDLYNDTVIREETYTVPLSTMPTNAKALIEEMMGEAAKDKNLTVEQLTQIEKDIYQMTAKGAVAQRNFEMQKTRGQISATGNYISWFMKQKGMSFQTIQAKYQNEFSEDERKGHLKIIESASRSNQALLNKFYGSLVRRFWGTSPPNQVVPAQSKL